VTVQDGQSPAYPAIFFDIDGTLVDSNEGHIRAWQEAFEAVGVHFPYEKIHAQIGKGADMLIPALLPNASESERNALADAQGAAFKSRFLSEVKPFADAHALLARAAESGQKVVLASSASQAQLDHYLDLLEARDLVTATTCADDVGNTKPAPDIFAVALEKVSPLEPGDVLVIGDTPYDIEAAAKCDIKAVALRSGGFSDNALNDAGAIALYDDAAALLRGYDASPLGRCQR
jgi:phosphoglycolate phosphatase-like HAD superfamily hydrolase